MTVLSQRTVPATQRSHHRAAWALIAITPVGLAVSGICWLWLLDLLNAATFPSDRFGASFDFFSTVLALTVAGTLALAAPSVALVTATSAAREEGRTAHRVLVGSWGAFALCVMVFGVFGLLVWGPVIYSRLREPDRSKTRH